MTSWPANIGREAKVGRKIDAGRYRSGNEWYGRYGYVTSVILDGRKSPVRKWAGAESTNKIRRAYGR